MTNKSLTAAAVTDKGIRLPVIYVRLSQARKWEKNPKRHDFDKLIASLRRYGFRDAPIYDETLGALVGGNGRLEALERMQAQGKSLPPAGVLLDTETGEWCLPVQVGVNAKSVSEAEQFAVDHNNLTLAGADHFELWNEGYLALITELKEQGQLPISISDNDMEAIALRMGELEAEGGRKEFGEFQDQNVGEDNVRFAFGEYRGLISRKTYDAFAKRVESLRKSKKTTLGKILEVMFKR